MAAPSSATSLGLKDGELKNHQNQQLQHSPGEGASPVMASSPSAASTERRKRTQPGYPSPGAEVIALSPNTLTATNRFMCEVCTKGFQREQNLQLHRRGHNLPWKLKTKTNHEARKKVYICPEIGCVHHDPSRALGDLTGIKKHFYRKHGEKRFSCDKCNKKYAVHSDWKAHNKVCGTKEYKCECGTTFSRRDSFTSHRSFCDALSEEVARHTLNCPPYPSMAASILANASNAGSMSLGSAAGSMIPENLQQLSSPLFGLGGSIPNSYTSLLSGQSVGSAFQPIQPPNVPLHPVPEPRLSFPRVSDFSGIQGFPNYRAPNNMFNLGFNGGADVNGPQNHLDLHNPFGALMMNAEASAYNILNSTLPDPELSATALLQKAAMTGGSSNNASLVNAMGGSLPGGMKLNNYGGAFVDGMRGGRGEGGSTFQEMYNNLNVGVGAGSYGTGGFGGGMEYLSDQMNAPYGGMMYNVKNANGMLVNGVNNYVVVHPQMNVQGEFCNKLTRDFLGMGNEMKNLGGDGLMENDRNGDANGTNSPDSEATTSADVGPSVPGRHPGF